MIDFFRKNLSMFLLPVLFAAVYVALNAFGIADVSLLEFVTVVLSMVSIMLLRREYAIGYAFSFIAQMLFIMYFLRIGLTGQVILGAVVAGIDAISFYSWIRPDKKTKKIIQPSFMNPTRWLIVLAGLAIIIIWRYSSGTISILDYLVLYLGLFGQILLIRKKADGWLLWILFDILSIGLFWLSGSYLLFLRSFIDLYNETRAFIEWTKKIISIRKRRNRNVRFPPSRE